MPISAFVVFYQIDSSLRKRNPGLRARLADTVIAQSCLDQKVALVTGDRDFRNFGNHAGVTLE